MSEMIQDSGHNIGHMYCIADEFTEEGKRSCGSSDALAIYEHDGEDGELWYDGYCYSCCQHFNKDIVSRSSLAEDLGISVGDVKRPKKVFDRKPKAEPIKIADAKKMIQEIGYKGNNYRKISDEVLKFYGHLTKVDSKGNVLARYYPETINNKLTGYKCRNHPKDFRYGKVGLTGLKCQLSGQHKFTDYKSCRDILIVGGEEDKAAAYQMLLESLRKRKQDEFADIPVVSPTAGEGSAVKQIKEQYDFLDQFENIIVGMDNDDAGHAATEKILEVLPKHKVKIAKWTYKDPNKHLIDGKQGQFVRDFYNAKEVIETSIVKSTDIDSMIEEELLLKKIGMPSFMQKAERMMAGGMPLGYIINIIGETGIGKCLGKDTPVMLSDGSVKKVQNIITGEYLMGNDGSPRKVLSTVTGKENLYKIKQAKYEDYVVNESHILSLKASFDRPSKGWKKGDVVNMSVKDYLQLLPTHKRCLRGYCADLVNFGGGEVFEPYMIGLWLADGTTSKAQLSFNREDEELIKEFYDFCDRNNYQVKLYPSNDRDTVLTLDVLNGFRGKLRELGLLNNKHIPDVYRKSSYEDRMNLLAGILDGDGYKGCGDSFEIVFKKESLADDFIWLARSLGFKTHKKSKFNKCQNFEGAWYTRVFVKGFTSKIPNRLTRKKCIKTRHTNSTLDTITVEYLGEGDYYGFEIDGNKLFCLGDFTVTHNTSITNEMIYHWIFNCPYKMAVSSQELTAGQYGVAMLSRHIGNKLQLFENGQDAVEFINQPEIIEKRQELWQNEYGEERWLLLDDREGTLSEFKLQCEKLVKKHGVKFIVIDPISDLFDGVKTEDQEAFVRWQKQFIKRGVTFINICHTNKAGSGNRSTGGNLRDLGNDDIMGTSTLAKSGGCNIFLMRDVYSDCPIMRNTTWAKASKIRWSGKSGIVGKWYYDIETHTMYDFDEYFNRHPEKLPEGFDRTATPFDKGKQEKPKRAKMSVTKNEPDFVEQELVKVAGAEF